MRVLIWFLCFSVLSVLILVLKSAGIVLGGIPTVILYVITGCVAGALSKALYNKRKNKNQKQIEKKLSKEGLSAAEYLEKNVPESVLEICEFYRGKPLELEPYLASCVKTKKINKEVYKILLYEYSK